RSSAASAGVPKTLARVSSNSPSQPATTTVARQLPIRFTQVRRIRGRKSEVGYQKSEIGERTRLACCRWRPRHRGRLGDCFAEAPKPAREARALPGRPDSPRIGPADRKGQTDDRDSVNDELERHDYHVW